MNLNYASWKLHDINVFVIFMYKMGNYMNLSKLKDEQSCNVKSGRQMNCIYGLAGEMG